MSLKAGIDVGNATTEVLIAEVGSEGPVPLAWDRRPTLGGKGSLRASEAAAALLARLERRHGVRVDEVLVTPQVATETAVTTRQRRGPDTGRLLVITGASGTPAGHGAGVGRPVHIDSMPQPGPVVLVATDPLGFRHTVDRVAAWLAAGADVRGLILAGDEARLVSARVGTDLPVVDGIDVAPVLAADRVAVEVAPAGGVVR